jgi:antitoxin VapB
MPSVLIKNDEAASSIARLAARMGTSKTEAVLRAVRAYEANLSRELDNPDAPEWLKQFWLDHPLPPPTGLKADKAFFDWLSGEEDIE